MEISYYCIIYPIWMKRQKLNYLFITFLRCVKFISLCICHIMYVYLFTHFLCWALPSTKYFFSLEENSGWYMSFYLGNIGLFSVGRSKKLKGAGIFEFCDEKGTEETVNKIAFHFISTTVNIFTVCFFLYIFYWS